jgi:hypothetical protein
MPLHRDLAAKRAGVLAVLLDFDLLDLLSERSTVAVMAVSRMLSPCFSNSSISIAHHYAGKVSYRVPYLPVIPTFFVRFVIAAVLDGGQ